MNEKTVLKNAELYKEDGFYWLKLIYEVEDDKEVAEIFIPKVSLPLRLNECALNHATMFHGIVDPPTISLHEGIELTVHKDKDGIVYGKRVLKEKVHELTMDEVEKKLGFKVKIVNKPVGIKGKDCPTCVYYSSNSKCKRIGNNGDPISCATCKSEIGLTECPCCGVYANSGELCPNYEKEVKDA